VQTGTIFDIKKFAIHDGPGIRTTVFFKGCPLGCWLCHNPESQAFEPELMLRAGRCDRCGDCIAACPPGAISLNSAAVRIERTRCDMCGACADACLTEAIEVAGRQVTVDQVMAEIEKDRVYYEVSGGEPLSQADFLVELLEACKAKGLTTAVDTCGYVAPDVFRKVASQVDLFLYDLKLMGEIRHTEFTGYGNRSILENLRWLGEQGIKTIVRVPLLPGINDDAENVGALGGFVSGLATGFSVDILPYHTAGVDKYARLDRKPTFPDLEPPAAERIADVVQQLKDYGLDVTVRGERA
jgi:pyruvate formate lyase activating enzyme